MNKQKLLWVEIIKAFALIWIFFNHISEQIFGYPMFANPISNWTSLPERIAQLAPLADFGLWNIPINFFRYIGWTGDQGVQLFIIISGFGLTIGLLQRDADKLLKTGEFFIRRAERIYPLWWGVHVLFISVWLFTGKGLSVFEPATIISMLGMRITPSLLYYFSPAWWYFGLLLQLYLVYPILWGFSQKWGPGKLLLWGSVVPLVVRGVGLYTFDGYLDAWSRGAIFITRLPEFVFGISLAIWMVSQPKNTNSFLNSTKTLVVAIAIYILGSFLSMTLLGMTVAPFLLGVGIFVTLYQIVNRVLPVIPNWLRVSGGWIGEHSYSLYLVHHPVIFALVPFGITVSYRTTGRILLSIVVTFALALLLEALVNFFVRVSKNLVNQIGMIRAIFTITLLGGLLLALLIGAELLTRRFAPQEIYGWGERSSLEPDNELGWRLIPSKVTRLRWSNYDYTVEANSLGFPGPEYQLQKPENVYRIIVTGDAFTSAEGVNTSQAWPRLLETDLQAKVNGKDIQVLNFAITGYGPNQYVAVMDKFVPLYKPDLIVVELFVNDFQDVLWSNADFQTSIGFDSLNPESLISIIKLEHFRHFTELNAWGPIREFLRNEPNPNGYFLGNFKALETGHPEIENDARQLTFEKLKNIQEVASQYGAKVVYIFVPASVQTCKPDKLAYYPNHVDINDTTRFDLNLPQKLMTGIVEPLNVPLYDLRDVLSTDSDCYYQPHNMHWTISGHRVVAEYISDILIRNGYLP